MNNQEIWKPISGYEGIYEVSNMGRVRRVGGHQISQNLWSVYKVVHLSRCGKTKTLYVHRLVATAFVPNPLLNPIVNHKDCNKLNNHADNLEWCTKQENEIHAWENGLKEKIRHTSAANAIIARSFSDTKIPVTQFTLDGKEVKTWDSASDAMRETGIDNSSISKCCRGKNKRLGASNGDIQSGDSV